MRGLELSIESSKKSSRGAGLGYVLLCRQDQLTRRLEKRGQELFPGLPARL